MPKTNNQESPFNIFRIGDSIYSNEILSEIGRISKADTLVSTALYLNVSTLLAVLLCELSINITTIIYYIGAAYTLITMNTLLKLALSNANYKVVRYVPILEVLDDSALLLALPTVTYFKNTNEFDSTILLVGIVIFITSLFSIRYFTNFIISKIYSLIFCICFILLNIHDPKTITNTLFSLTAMFVMLIALGCWAYIRHIRLHHITIGYRRLYDEIKRNNRSLEKLKSSRDKIIRHIGHDLRQPVNALSYSLFNITHEKLSKMQQEQVSHGKQSINLINYMIDELLQLSLLENRGELSVLKQSFQLNELFKKIESDFKALSKKPGTTLSIVHTSIKIFSDPNLVERVIQNFLSNAVKHGNGGRILLGVRRKKSSVHIQLLDQGPGIEGELLSDIFGEFIQGENSTGFGMGLNIARNVAEAIGGKIIVNSKINSGTDCSLILPYNCDQ